jgi:hypothetical protein
MQSQGAGRITTGVVRYDGQHPKGVTELTVTDRTVRRTVLGRIWLDAAGTFVRHARAAFGK